MRSIKLKAGDVLYEEGDPSDCVYFIEAGNIEVRRGVADDAVSLATLGKGEILGEMGVIRRTPRSTTLVATTPTTLTRVEGDDFLQAFGGADGLGLKLLRMICDRLSATNDLAQEPTEEAPTLRQDVGEIRLLGASPEIKALLGPTGVVLAELPFTIGRGKDGPMELSARSLALPIAGKSAQLGERHFRIELGENGQLQARDLESQYGCLVNGRRISAFERIEAGPVAALKPGDNEIVAGGVYSPVRFVLRVRLADQAAA